MDQQPQPAGHVTEDSLANRYGRAQSTSNPRARRRGIIIAVVALIAAVLVTVWIAYSATADRLSWKDVGYSIASDQEASVTFQLTKEPEATVTCSVQILAENYAVVGFDTVTIGPEPEDESRLPSDMTRYYEAPLRTDGLGVSGVVDTCWYAGEGPSNIQYINTGD
ncbi:DUF4307 domain-containing protein [Citricoccus muralis]|uniref:DUF4307 domain-containing protein n=1 Tax=Citricoccus muralis TaxID=169134 RepID=A0ABY8H9R5_9MICC|nr:DUF4307 domain-containing protein [Citricoccus muralis]WFP17373.1 DUF4307 domain-containing protein [Citricoccus muralis]